MTRRGPWYHVSWKGSEERSGGLATNIGIHMFDLLLWLFGPASRVELHWKEPSRMAGFLELERADVRWLLSIDPNDLARLPGDEGRTSRRSISIDGEELEFTEGFGDLHTMAYRSILDGHGPGVADARPSIELVHAIRSAPVVRNRENEHSFLAALSD